MQYTISAVLIALGTFAGYHYRTMNDKIKELDKKVKEQPKRTGVTPGAYKKGDEFKANPLQAKSGVINPKTPKRMEFDNQEQIEKESANWRVQPK